MNMEISTANEKYRKTANVLDSQIAYIDEGAGDPIVFLHGNPTSSYLWRNVIPHVVNQGRCLAPDLIGMGYSGENPYGTYQFVDHAAYLDAWFEALGISENVTLVIHDWGSALGFYWAQRNPEKVKAIVYMEAFVKLVSWEEWPENARGIFQAMRSPVGEEIVLQKNVFVERILPNSIIRDLRPDEMEEYRRRFIEPGESRRPTLTWPRQIPFEGEPKEVEEIVASYSEWLTKTEIPKLFINAEPGSILIGNQREFCRSWPNQTEVTVKGLHFIQEDSPKEIGEAIVSFRNERNLITNK
jgi:haloalkane dehalogenase